MANKAYTGNAPSIAQVTGWTFGGTWETDDVIVITIGTKSVSVVAGSTVIATIVDFVVTSYNLLSSTYYPEYAEMTASRSSNDFRLTADAPGVPFTVTITTTEAGGGAADAQTISSATTVTANSGPNDWSVAANWDTGAVPVNTDDVIIEGTDTKILYGLAQSAVTLASLTIRNYGGQIGLPKWAGKYWEYRPDYLAVSATTVTVNCNSGRIKLNTGANASTVACNGMGSRAETGIPAFLLKGSNPSNALNLRKGDIGLAVFAGETAQFPAMRVSYESNIRGDAKLKCGSGVTWTTLDQSGGEVELNSAGTTIQKTGGTLTYNSGNLTTLNELGGTTYWNAVATCTTVNLANDGHLDLSQDLRTGKTFSNCNRYGKESKITDPNRVATWTNGVDVEFGSDLSGLRLGTHIRLTVAAAS